MVKKLLNRKQKGFTIVELVIVIAVIAILAAVLIPTFINLTSKANKASDESLVTNLNKALAIEEVDHDINNMHDAVESLKREGYLASALVTKSDQKLLYNLDKNRFLLEEDKTSVDYEGYSDYEFWTIQNSYDVDDQQYSIYASDDFLTENISGLKVGFDAGDSDKVSSIEYVGVGTTQTVVIRTNGIDAALSVNAPFDTVHHYNDLYELNVISVDPTHSYHEHGRVRGKAVISEGHFIVEDKATVNNIVVSESAAANSISFDISTTSTVQSIMDYSSGAVKTSESTIPETITKVEVPDNKEAYVKSTNTCYDTLYEALNAAASGDLVLLLKDVSVTETHLDSTSGLYYTYYIDKDLTLDGNDKTITAVGKVEKQDTNGNDVYTHDLFFCISKADATRPAEIKIKNININSSKQQDALLAQENFTFGPTVTFDKVNIVCEGECLYSNGGTATVIAYDSYFEHSGIYATGKDPVYYSAVIVGYAGSASIYNCRIKSFGNGAATFPSGGTINLNNTDIESTFGVDESLSGYALYVWNGKDNQYVDYCANAIINVHSGNIEGDFGFVDASVRWSPEINIYSGTFDHDPTTYVEAGKFIEHSGSKWIVS